MSRFTVQPLEPPDSLHLQAAEGWFELGSVEEALGELRCIGPAGQQHPEVLAFLWEIHATRKDWAAGLEVAATLVQADPENPSGWVHRSYCLHELKNTVEARDNLLLVVDRFPASATIRYNLACYECQLGRLAQARNWLSKALKVGNAKKLKRAALEDPDLAPLRAEIEQM